MIVIWSCLIVTALTLTGDQAQSFCHCDLTSSFCDADCCCDTDCSSTITIDCYNSKSNSYCPDSTFFARLGSTYINPQGCFYYNSSSSILDEVALSTGQIDRIINAEENDLRIATVNKSTRAGYQMADPMALGGSSTFQFVQSGGACGTGGPTFTLKFGLSMKLSCTSSSGTPQIYTVFSGKTLEQFSGDNSITVTIPSFGDSTTTHADLKIIIGYYGSDNSKYIQRVTVSTSTQASSNNKRSLNVYFVQPSELKDTGSSPTFFPQISTDIFYPVYLLD